MKTWQWVLFFAVAVAAHFLAPAWLSAYLPWVVGFVMVAYLGGRIDECLSRISYLEAEVAAHEFLLDKFKREMAIDIPDRFYEIEKRL